jgi:tetratricopeptide (TPR) repeat protein
MTETLLPSSQLSLQNPWPGLRPFTESDREFFFGRERETAELLSLVQRATVVVLYGQSGLGKTSLLQAGVFPELKRLDFLPFRLRLDHSEDFPPFACQIKDALASQLDGAGVNGPRPGASETLWEYFHRRDMDFWGPRNRLLTPVIVLDQFEEMFTLGRRTENALSRVTQFAKELEALLEHRPPQAIRERLDLHPEDGLQFDFQRQGVKLVLSLREDFLAHLDTWRTRMPSLLPHRFRLEPMTGAQALEVVQRAGRELVEPDVARDIVDFVSSSQRRRLVRVMEQREVEPALLSVICDELNRRRLERGQTRITADLLTAEREGIIHGFYERAFEGVGDGVRDWVEDELLTATGYRDRGALEDAIRLGLPEGAFDQLVDRRILHREEREGVVWLELTHDLLSDPAAQSRTVRVQRRQAKAAAKREAEYAHELRRTRTLVTIFAVLLLVAGVALIYAFTMKHHAEQAQKAMQIEKDRADGEARKAQGSAALAEDNLRMAVETAEKRASDTANWLRGEFLHPTPVSFKSIEQKIDAVSTDERQFDGSIAIKHRYAESLAVAAEVLFHQGRYKEGLEYAERALNLINQLETQEKETPDESHRLMGAEAHYALGTGLIETGRASDARRHFEESIRLAGNVRDASSRLSAGRVSVLSQIGLGEVGVRSFSLAAAEKHFKAGLRLANTTDFMAHPDEVDSWRVLSLLGLGRNLMGTEDAEALGYFDEANQIVNKQKKGHPDNLLWQELYADVAYWKGFAALNLSRFANGSQMLKDSLETSVTLSNLNRDNMKWRFLLAQSHRGIGMLQQRTGDLERSQASFIQLKQVASEIKQEQPFWLRASHLYALSRYHMGDLARNRNDADTARSEFQAARHALANLVAESPENPDYARSLAWVLYFQGLTYAQGNTGEARQKALGLYAQAFQSLRSTGGDANNSGFILDLKAQLHQQRGNVLRDQGALADAISAYEEAAKIRAEVVKLVREPSDALKSLSAIHVSLGTAYVMAGQPARAASQYNEAAEAIEYALKLHPRDTTLLQKKAEIQRDVSDLWFKQGNLTRSIEALESAFGTAKQAFNYEPYDYGLMQFLESFEKLIENFNEPADSAAPSDSNSRLSPQLLQRVTRRVHFDTLLLPEGYVIKDNKIVTEDGVIVPAKPQNWVLPPLIPGAWHTLVPRELEIEIKRLPASDQRFAHGQIVRVRVLSLNFYNNAMLFEAETRQENGERGVINYIRRGDETIFLDGTSPPIHEMNQTLPPNLDTVDQATAYLRFFAGSIKGDDGRFNLIDRAEELHWLPETTDKLRANLAHIITPLIVQETRDGRWGAVGTVQYTNALFYSIFRLSRNGQVEMGTDNPVAAELPILAESFVNGIRLLYTDEVQLEEIRAGLKKNPNDRSALKKMPDLCYRLKRWKEAVEAQQSWVAFLQREAAKDDKEQREKLKIEYASLSRYQLFARDFAGALASSEAGRRLDESYLPLDTNRAHALLFLGRTQEAEAIYLQHRGKKVGANSDKKWEEAILEDFKALKKERVTHPEMMRIQKLLKVESK